MVNRDDRPWALTRSTDETMIVAVVGVVQMEAAVGAEVHP